MSAYGVDYKEEEFLPLSGLQHFMFCRRQWALIHIEQQWKENWRTADGEIFHERTHDEGIRERRGDILTVRGLAVFSREFGLSAKCDVVEFHQDENGVALCGEEGLWLPYPVEYKRGTEKEHQADAVQLCAQGMCLEEMLCCSVSQGALYYGEMRRRVRVEFTPELRKLVRDLSNEMHELYRRGYTPKVKPAKGCSACSLKELCLPRLQKGLSAASYLNDALEE